MASDPVHLQPTAALARRALLPGDPGRALALASALFDPPARMFNHSRGLWGYTGEALDGAPLTVQSTGLGGPSAAIVLEELCDLGLRSAVRIGTCSALDGGPPPGTLVAVSEVLCGDGASRALGAGERIAGDAELTAALADHADAIARVASGDLLYEPDAAVHAAWAAAGAVAFDLASAAVLAVGARRGVRVAALLAVTARGGERLAADGLAEVGLRLGRAGLAALATTPG